MQNTNIINAAQLTLASFAADMQDCYWLLLQTADTRCDVMCDPNPLRSQECANFRSRATLTRIWLAYAIKLCVRHGIALPRMRRVSRIERTAYATTLLGIVMRACADAGVDGPRGAGIADPLDFDIDIVSPATPLKSALALNTRLTPAKRRSSGALVRMPHFYLESKMFQRFAVAVSILALCLASVSCLAHAVASV